jgi:hypothetical protein
VQLNGLMWWWLAYTPPKAPLWNDLRIVVHGLAQLRDALAAPATRLPLKVTYHDTAHSLDRGIEWLAKPHGRETLLMAVNADGNPVEVTISGLDRFRRCESALDSGAVTWTKGDLREHFDPFGSRVWRLS